MPKFGLLGQDRPLRMPKFDIPAAEVPNFGILRERFWHRRPNFGVQNGAPLDLQGNSPMYLK